MVEEGILRPQEEMEAVVAAAMESQTATLGSLRRIATTPALFWVLSLS